MNGRIWVLLLGWCVLLASEPGWARIYKYQDADGNWHFSDKPITQKQQQATRQSRTGSSAAPEAQPPSAATAPQRDLVQRLEQRFQPSNPIERVTLSVLSVETAMGVGSGFFISDDGYILTNKHVVRPAGSGHWQKARDKLEQTREQLEKRYRWLKSERERLTKLSAELSAYKGRIERASEGALKRSADSDYRIMAARYQHWQQEYDRVKDNYQQQKSKYEQARSDFSRRTSQAKLATRFKVYLKDDTSLQAELVHLSANRDLALLKVDGYRTPFLQGFEGRPAQSSKVFAVGSPLGLRDYVTAGIITRVQADTIVTDTQILPGNSGGPLVTEQGLVLGINTLKMFSDSVNAAGFGVAIPLPMALQEFRAQLQP